MLPGLYRAVLLIIPQPARSKLKEVRCFLGVIESRYNLSFLRFGKMRVLKVLCSYPSYLKAEQRANP